jgi:ABC-type uncharacterized transport system permease subunit
VTGDLGQQSDRLLSVTPSIAFWIAVGAYAAALAALLLFLSGRKAWALPATVLVALAFVAHGVDIGWRGTLRVHPAQSVREAIGFLSWMLTGGYLLASLRYRLILAGVLIEPVAVLLLLAARLSPAGVAAGDFSSMGRLHIVLATCGIAVFALASVLAIVYLLEERGLKRKRFDSVSYKVGTPLESLDGLAHRLVWVGFPLFTVAVALGVAWAAERGGGYGRIEHLLSLITWAVFAALLVSRTVYGWRGKRAAKLTLAGFAVALLVLAAYLLRRVIGA